MELVIEIFQVTATAGVKITALSASKLDCFYPASQGPKCFETTNQFHMTWLQDTSTRVPVE